MRAQTIFIIIALCFPIVGYSGPYKFDTSQTLSSVTLGALMGMFGTYQENQLGDPTLEEIAELDRSDIATPDKIYVGEWNHDAQVASDVFLFTSPLVAAPFFIRHKHDSLLLGSLYLEMAALTLGGTYLAKGTVKRFRPFVYDDNAPMDEKLERDSTRSFFSGHTSVVTAHYIFAAKLFSDYYPRSTYRPYVWTGAVAGSVATGVLRMLGGKHFASDVAVGLVWGGLVGYGVPEMHRRPQVSFQVLPILGPDVQGFSLLHKF